jgi:long-chain acyl-CoA synthetase
MNASLIPQTLADLPASAARKYASKRALITNDAQLSFAELDRRVTACAGGLDALGIGPGSKVIVHLPNGWEWIVAYYAVARVGAVVIPVNIMLVGEEVAFIAADCGAAAIITRADKLDALQRMGAGPTLQHLIAVGHSPEKGYSFIAWDTLLTGSPLREAGAIAPEDVATICYTSGTTGVPKGALLSHRAIVTNTAMTALMHARTIADTVVTALPLSHVYGNVVMNGAFLVGYTLVLLERYDADVVLAAIDEHQATLFEGVPTMYYYMLGSEKLQASRLRSLTRCTVGGQSMTLTQMKEVQARLGCPLYELWGMTEIAGLGTTHPAYTAPKLGSIGVPLPLSERRVVSLDDPAKPVATGEIGELAIRGPTVMRGYLNRAADTAAVLGPDGWLLTGDIARADAEGYLYVVDRKKEMIITAGYNIYPSELERVIAAHPAVQMVAVGGVSDELKGEAAHAFVVLRSQQNSSEVELVSYCREHLAAYKVPKRIHFVSELPRTSTGKLMRRALADIVNRGPGSC